MCSQNQLRFFGDVAYDDEYNGLVEGGDEGQRLARVLGDKHVLFLRGHGVIVVADDVAQAWDQLYYLERACMTQVLAMGTHQPLFRVADRVCRFTQAQVLRDLPKYARLHFDAQCRLLHPHPPAGRARAATVPLLSRL